MLSSRLALAAGVVFALMAPAAVVLAQPGNTLPPAPPAPGPPSGSPAGSASASASASSTAPPPTTPPPGPAQSGSAPPAPAPAPRAPGSAARSPGAPPVAPPGYPYPYPPRAGAPSAPPPGYRSPPPGYAYPPPGYGYPPPGYGYPPSGYETAPPPKPKPKRPPHDAASRSPFFDALAGAVVEGNRFDDFLLTGGEAGLFVADRLRLSARLLTFLSQNSDSYPSGALSSGYEPVDSKPPSILWGGSAGFAVVSASGFLLSPGILFMRTDVSDYGSFLGVNVPLEWVYRSGFRIGFEIALGRSFGGTVIQECYTYYGSACTQGTKNEISRDAGSGFYAAFEIGWGIK